MKEKKNQITITAAAIAFGIFANGICFANTFTPSPYEEEYLKKTPAGSKTHTTDAVSHFNTSGIHWGFGFYHDSEGNLLDPNGNPLHDFMDVTPLWRLMNARYYVNIRLPRGNFIGAKRLLVEALSTCVGTDRFGHVSAYDTFDGRVKFLNDMYAIRISPELDAMVVRAVRGSVDLAVLPTRYMERGQTINVYPYLYNVCLGMAKILNIEFAWNEQFGVYEFRPKNKQ